MLNFIGRFVYYYMHVRYEVRVGVLIIIFLLENLCYGFSKLGI